MGLVGRSASAIWPQGLTNLDSNGCLTSGKVNAAGQFPLLNETSDRSFKIANFSDNDQKLVHSRPFFIFPVGHNLLLPRIKINPW